MSWWLRIKVYTGYTVEVHLRKLKNSMFRTCVTSVQYIAQNCGSEEHCIDSLIYKKSCIRLTFLCFLTAIELCIYTYTHLLCLNK